MVRLARQRHRQADVISAAQGLVERVHAQQLVDRDAAVVSGRRIVLERHDPHAERPRARRDRLADPPEAHDQQRLARQLPGTVGAGRRVPLPAPRELGPKQLRQPAREHQDHRQHVLRDVRPVHAAGAGDRDAAREQRRRGDAVQPRRHRAEPAHAPRARELVIRQRRRDDHVRVGQSAREVGRGGAGERERDAPVEAGQRAAEAGGVGGVGRQIDQNADTLVRGEPRMGAAERGRIAGWKRRFARFVNRIFPGHLG